MHATHEHVWDRFIRFFHWSLVLVFVLLFFSAEYEYDEVHFLLAYALVALVAARIIWGFTVSGHAHFSSFFYPASETIAHIKTLFLGNSERYIGHNPAGALMIFGFLTLLIIMIVSGFVLLTWGEYEGPLWAMGMDFADATAQLSRTIHETVSNILWLMVLLHLVGVTIASWKHRENLVAAMWHGKKRSHEP